LRLVTRSLVLGQDGWEIGGAELVQRGGTWFLHRVQHAPAPPSDDPTGYLGVDLGVVNVATLIELNEAFAA
jgi:transposase